MKTATRTVCLALALGSGVAGAQQIPQIPGLPDLNQIPFIQQIIQLVPGLGDALNSIPDLSNIAAVPDWVSGALPDVAGAAATLGTSDMTMPDLSPENVPSLSQVVQDAQSDPNPPKAPMYDRKNIYDMSSLRPVPHAQFINVDHWRAYQDCKAKGEADTQCGRYTYTVPYSLDTETVRVGQDLRAAWQRFEDRTYWHALVKLNNPAMLASHCIIDWRNGNTTALPNLTINVAQGMYPKELNGKIPDQPVDDQLRMDRYGISPFVPNNEYCSGVNIDLSIMYLPGSCVYTPSMTKLFCVEGTQETLNPLSPKPIAFQYGAALNRVTEAIKDAESDYLKDYNADVLKAIKPTAKFFPTLWDTMLTGSLIAPTTTLKPDVASLTKSEQDAGKNLGSVFRSTAPIYYAQGVTSNALTQPLLVHILPRRNDVLGVPNPPGVWPLEEYKRTFKIQPLPIADRLGYTTMFRAWTQPTAALLPEAVEAKPLRQMIYMAEGNNFILPSPFPIPVPAPVLLKEFAAGLPYVGVQTHFTWQSVPEGYEVPGVRGTPLVNYPLEGK